MAGSCPCACIQKALLPLVAITFAAWVVSLGGLASMQAVCAEPSMDAGYLAGVRGFSPVPLSCSRIYSYYWFIVALEFVLISGLALAVVGGHLSAMRIAWTGLLAVAAMLYIQSADSFLAVTSVQHYKDGQELHRARATAAGFIMTAIFNFVLLIAVGSEAPAEDSQEKGQNCQYPPQYTAEHV